MREGSAFDDRQRRIAARVRQLLDGVAPERGADFGAEDNHLGAPITGDAARRNAVVIGCAVVVAAVLTGAWVLSSRPHTDAIRAGTPQPAASDASPRSTGTASSRTGSSAQIVVDVAGKVRRPGLYRLSTGSRVDDALRAAGGTMPGVNEVTVNRAARISDGQQIVVGIPPPAVAAGGAGADGRAGGDGSAGGAAAGPININSASLGQLEQLPGVGPVLAQHILDWRTAHGSFATIDQLQSVSGIGPAKFAAMRALVAV